MDSEAFCYVTTTGRVTRNPHRIEIWFATEDGRTLLLLAGAREASDWVKNIVADPAVDVEVGGSTHRGRARILDEGDREDDLARRLLVKKYGPDGLEDWGRRALAVAIDLDLDPIWA